MKLEERDLREAKCCIHCKCCLVLEGDVSFHAENYYLCYCMCDLPEMVRKRRMTEIWKEFIDNGKEVYKISDENIKFLNIKCGAVNGKRYTDSADVCNAFEPFEDNRHF